MDYQKKLRAGIIDYKKEIAVQQKLQNMQKVLQPLRVINPYAPLIELPQEMFKPRRTLTLLLSFIEAITFYHQYQRELKAEPASGEAYIETTPNDIEWGFKLLKETLFRRSDELSEALRGFLDQVKKITGEQQLVKFKATDIRQHIFIPPRTLQYYLKELTDYGYIQIIGGKQRTGYEYEICRGLSESQLQQKINRQLAAVMEKIHKAHQEREAKSQRQEKKKTGTSV